MDARPALLFHYTGAEGLMGILGGSWWATRADFLNDSTEMRWAFDLAGRRVAEAGLPDQLREQVVARLRNPVTSPPHVASFSGERDLLSQWRGYTGSKGFALAFDPAGLDAWSARTNGLSLSRCVHQLPEQEGLIDGWIRDASERFARAAGTGWERAEVASTEFALTVAREAIRLKADAFREEREWRLSWQLRFDESGPLIGFRPQGDLVVPYLALQTAQLLPALREIIIGPASRAELAETGLKSLLGARGLDVKIAHSAIPCRLV